MVSFDPNVKNNIFKVGGVNPYAPQATSFKGGEIKESPEKGWEAYHTGQGPNGLKGGFTPGAGLKLNMYM